MFIKPLPMVSSKLSAESITVEGEFEENDDLDIKSVKTIRNNIISIIEQDLIKIGAVIERDLSVLLYKL